VALPSLFEFTLVKTVQEMWTAGIYPVFFLVVVFSGVWPYAKLLIMLYCFVSKKIHDVHRGQLLLALDALGKFSLVDTYVLVLMMVAFRYHLQLFDADVVGLDVLVVPEFGFYGFLLATTLSLVTGHAAVYYHRRAEISFPSGNTGDSKCPPQSLLLGHSYEVFGDRRQLSRFSQIALLFLWLSAAVLLGVGMTKKSFVFEFGGLAGIALGDENRRNEYSLVSLGTSIPDSTSGTLGPSIIMMTYFFYAVAAPFACLLFLIILLLVPMSVQRQLTLLFLAEIANAWSAVEVFCLSIVASLLEISTFASFIIGDRCDAVNEVIKQYWPDTEDFSDANCYTVHSSVKDAGILIVGALVNSFFVSIALRLVHTAMNDRIQQEGWVSLGSGSPFDDSLAQPESQWSFAERLIGVSTAISWLFVNSDSDHADADQNNQQGPPAPVTPLAPQNNFLPERSTMDTIGQEEDPQSAPWKTPDGFANEWGKDAERDPEWKSWKDQHQSSLSDLPEVTDPLIESPNPKRPVVTMDELPES